MTGDVRPTSHFLYSGDLSIELLHFDRPAAFGAPSMWRNQLGLTHLSFSVDDIDVSAQRAVELMKHPAGVSWPWYCRSPSRRRFTLRAAVRQHGDSRME